MKEVMTGVMTGTAGGERRQNLVKKEENRLIMPCISSRQIFPEQRLKITDELFTLRNCLAYIRVDRH